MEPCQQRGFSRAVSLASTTLLAVHHLIKLPCALEHDMVQFCPVLQLKMLSQCTADASNYDTALCVDISCASPPSLVFCLQQTCIVFLLSCTSYQVTAFCFGHNQCLLRGELSISVTRAQETQKTLEIQIFETCPQLASRHQCVQSTCDPHLTLYWLILYHWFCRSSCHQFEEEGQQEQGLPA